MKQKLNPKNRPENDSALYDILWLETRRMGSQAALAARANIDPRHLRSMISGNRHISKSVARALGFELKWVWTGQKTPLSGPESSI